MCPDQEWNQRPLTFWEDAQPTEPHWPGQEKQFYMTHVRAKSPSAHHLIRITIYPKTKSGHFILCLKSLVPPHLLRRKSWFFRGPLTGLKAPAQPCLLPFLPRQPQLCCVLSRVPVSTRALPSVLGAFPALCLPRKVLSNPQALAQRTGSCCQGTVTPGVPLFPDGLVPRLKRLVLSVSQASVWHTVGAQYIFAE